MVPVVELRGAIPFGAALGLPVYVSAIAAVIGNILPVPFIIFFIRKVFAWMRVKRKRLGNLADKLEGKANAKAGLVYKYEVIGLVLFVAIPLPGTGAWTGALIAALLNIKMKAAVPCIAAGVIIAGIIVSAATYGVIQIF
jgi:uncharacterized membrane protein